MGSEPVSKDEARVYFRDVKPYAIVDTLEHLLNQEQLLAVWSDLMLPRRVREMWESRFPELCPATVV